jgi:hypothetical protein
MRELLSQPSITRTADGLGLQYGTTSILLWCCVPLLAVALGTAGLMFVRYHQRRADPPSPSAAPVTLFSILALIFAIAHSVLLLPAIFLTQIRVTSTEATQDVGLWWASSVRQFAYEDIASIEMTIMPDESGQEPVWNIVWRSGEVEAFNPGDLWSANQQLIREQMQRHGVMFSNPPEAN